MVYQNFKLLAARARNSEHFMKCGFLSRVSKHGDFSLFLSLSLSRSLSCLRSIRVTPSTIVVGKFVALRAYNSSAFPRVQ